MTDDKTDLKKYNTSLAVIMILLLLIAGALSGFFLGYYSIIPSISNEISVFAMSMLSIVGFYLWKKMIPEFWELLLIIVGVNIGFYLNFSLSTDFISEPSLITLAGFLFTSFILLWSSSTLRKDISWRKKFTFIFLGGLDYLTHFCSLKFY